MSIRPVSRGYCTTTSKKVFTLRLSDEVFDKIGAFVTREHRSVTNYIGFVLLKHSKEIEDEQGVTKVGSSSKEV